MLRLRFGWLIALLVSMTSTLSAQEPVTITIHGDQDGGKISRHIYGHFAEHLGRCIYDGIWVGSDSDIPNTKGMRTDIVDAMKEIRIPNLRWPGGCFADHYHWRDGIGPRDQRPRRVNISWGQVIDTNAFGTHEFLDLCELVDAEPYLAGNMGSGTPEELQQWVEYITYDGDSEMANMRRKNGRDKPWKLPYLGVGNENWGCGGNMRAEYYADLFRRYATYCKDMSGNRLTRVACGPSGLDRRWTQTVMDAAHRHMQAYSVHFYTVYPSWDNMTQATNFKEKEWFRILKESLNIEKLIDESATEMDRVDPGKKIGLFVDEWGTWYSREEGTPSHALYQQNTLRDALVAGQSFHIFHEHCDRVKMANIAQITNVLQALFLTKDEKLVLTPTYHVFNMYKVHQEGTRLPLKFKSPEYTFEKDSMPAISVSASRAKDGKVHISLVNAHPRDDFDLELALEGVEAKKVTGQILTAEKLDEHNTFDSPDRLEPKEFDGAKINGDKLALKLPARAVLMLELE